MGLGQKTEGSGKEDLPHRLPPQITGSMPPASNLLQGLFSEDPDNRKIAIREMAQSGTQSDTLNLVYALWDHDEGVRTCAVEALQGRAVREVADNIITIIKEPETRDEVRLDAVLALRDTSSIDIVKTLLELSETKNEKLTACIMKALTGPETMKTILHTPLDDNEILKHILEEIKSAKPGVAAASQQVILAAHDYIKQHPEDIVQSNGGTAGSKSVAESNEEADKYSMDSVTAVRDAFSGIQLAKDQSGEDISK